MTKILYLDWNSFAGVYMKSALANAGVEVTLFPFDFNNENNRKDTRMDSELTMSLVKTIMSGGFDALFSFNYFPVAAMAAKACRIRYISWVYDSPYIQLYSQTINFPTNDIRLFDKAEVLRLSGMGVKTVSYLPLAAAPDIMKNEVASASVSSVKKYSSDISFVGSLYTEKKHRLFERFFADRATSMEGPQKNFDQQDLQVLNELIEKQKNIYGMNFIEESLTPELVEHMNMVCPISLHPDGFETRQWVYANYYMYRHVTALERTEILNLLSERDYDLKIYTHMSSESQESNHFPENSKIMLPHLTKKALSNVCGKVDYYKEAPVVFANSKINLNITLRSIESGIPLRAFEIMGCGGFLLTNYQEDFLEYFVPGEDFVYYEDYEDLIKKVDYYLTHDEQRERIAQNGYSKVCKFHTYEKRIDTLFQD